MQTLLWGAHRTDQESWAAEKAVDLLICEFVAGEAGEASQVLPHNLHVIYFTSQTCETAFKVKSVRQEI